MYLRRAWVAGLTSIMLLAACDSGPNEPDSLLYIDEVFGISDQAGYTFDLDVSLEVKRVNFDVTHNGPGYMTVRLIRDETVKVINTTPERRLELGNKAYVANFDDPARVTLYMHFDPSHEICRYLKTDGHTCRYPVASIVIATSLGPDKETELEWYFDHGNPLNGVPESTKEIFEDAFANPVGFTIQYYGDDSGRFKQECAGPDRFPAIAQYGGCAS